MTPRVSWSRCRRCPSSLQPSRARRWRPARVARGSTGTRAYRASRCTCPLEGFGSARGQTLLNRGPVEASDVRPLIEAAFADRALLAEPRHRAAVHAAIELLDAGKIRVATQLAPGKWETHAWVKQAVLLYFGVAEMRRSTAGPIEFFDKIPLKHGLEAAGVRVVPPGTVRYGAFVEPGAIVMPGYVNIGAWVGSGTMVDTWATVGSCAQIGKNCHLSGGVGIGGVLEPPGAQPVIVEDGCFIGSRAIIVEGVLVESEAVIGAAV
ncbi:MAG: 2,3,4,5-tetrahydropyridine-2,6-dicarboxylate N-succinyltransferase, partial [Myxococcales bacterium]|nr:2,3,4,5-tetrahydropyridine-2,6-dicarboxylate N-succinyltransferase [Myxococcales bacterium]